MRTNTPTCARLHVSRTATALLYIQVSSGVGASRPYSSLLAILAGLVQLALPRVARRFTAASLALVQLVVHVLIAGVVVLAGPAAIKVPVLSASVESCAGSSSGVSIELAIKLCLHLRT